MAGKDNWDALAMMRCEDWMQFEGESARFSNIWAFVQHLVDERGVFLGGDMVFIAHVLGLRLATAHHVLQRQQERGSTTTSAERGAAREQLKEDCVPSPLRCESNGMRMRVTKAKTRTDKQGRRAKAWQRAEASCAKPTVQLAQPVVAS